MARHPKVKYSGGWSQEGQDWECIVGEGTRDQGKYQNLDNLQVSG